MMYGITRVVKREAGIEVAWLETAKREEKHDLFTFLELQEMRIQIEDLLEHPAAYRIDLQERKIYRSARGGDSF
jgi:hypothetical protein